MHKLKIFSLSQILPLVYSPLGLVVGDGFIRPEVCTFINSGRVTSINAQRGNLGTDKSVPYKKPCRFWRSCVLAWRAFGVAFWSFVRLAWQIKKRLTPFFYLL
ncbi:MAG: hypothetical protein FWG87_08605 [Defluviitaleaceae bacterium]|nr:hypothetical protein [Defluviitaleaceae bacterium]